MNMFLSLSVVLLVLYDLQQAEAKPSAGLLAGRRTQGQHYIIGGIDALPGAWPWQLSFQWNNGQAWGHFCGASLLSSDYALTAAHCTDGFAYNVLRMVAGLHDRRDLSGAVIRSVTSYTMHEAYDEEQIIYDIAVVRLSQPIADNGFNIGYARLPSNNNNDFSATDCVLTGWGRIDHSPSSALPFILQQVNMRAISTTQCNSILSGLNDISVRDHNICVFDTEHEKGSCNGDSGGPLNCPSDIGYLLAGVCSWGIGSQTYACMNDFPSVYTRTSSFLSWIAANTQ